ncbi:MAG: hypothetical protein JSW12_20635 [Deltaproteobacteria bacterium]|jgi:hypothetical protein|nr:MAG: hypothetical protein JSW12_20635 [Deltaproteobacteria bacterium]
MASTTDMNIVLGQGNAVKEVHNVRKQNLELNQQFVAQQTEEKKTEDRVKVQEFETAKKIGIEEDEEKKKKKGSGQDEKGSKKEQSEEASNLSEGNLIDIRV